jgi:hypothetical protein
MTQLLKTKGNTILKYFNKSLIRKYSITSHSKILSKNFRCIPFCVSMSMSLTGFPHLSYGQGNEYVNRAIKIKTNYSKFVNDKENQIFIKSISKSYYNTNFFLNCTFDKGRLKNLILWFLKNYGQKKTIDLLEEFKILGYGYATKAGISLGIEDLKIPPQKISLLAQAEKQIQIGQNRYKRGEITAVERVQRLIDTWHQTSENLKQEVIRHFEATDMLNPVYMMAFSGARGNISQVRQLVGMRGLMSDPQGQIIDFPIRSNFREGLTLTEYIISTYGARKGIVDTALRTANAGYLTRRLVDVAQHVIVAKVDCETTRGILVFDMKEGFKTIYSFQNRLIGRVLAKNVISNNKIIAFRNQEISSTLAEAIAKVTKKAYIRSPLTCKVKKLVCQLCYGWSLANNKIVSIGEAVGIIAAQSIGEPGTQLTMRTFHTGGVFSGGMSEQLIAQYDGYVEYSAIIPGICVRTPQGDIAFLTKAEGTLIFHRAYPEYTQRGLNNLNWESSNDQIAKNIANISKKKTNFNTTQSFKIPPYSLLFLRHHQSVKKKQIMAQLSTFSGRNVQKSDAEQTVYSELEGQVYLSDVNLLEKFSEYDDLSIQVLGRGYAWILSGKIYQVPFNTKMLAQSADLVNKKSLLNQVQWINSHACLLSNHISYSPIKSISSSSSHGSLTNDFFKKTSKFQLIETINFAHTQMKSSNNLTNHFGSIDKTYELNRNLNEISLKTKLLSLQKDPNRQNNLMNVNSIKNITNKKKFQFLKFTRMSSIRIVQRQFQDFQNVNKHNFFIYKLNKRNTQKRNGVELIEPLSTTMHQNNLYTPLVKKQSQPRVIPFSMLTLTSKYKNKKYFIPNSKKIKSQALKKKFMALKYTNEFKLKNKNRFIYEKSYDNLTYYPFQKYTRKYLLKLFNKSGINLTKKLVLKGLFENNDKNKNYTLIFEESKHFYKYRHFFEYDLLLQQQFNRKKKNLLVLKNTFSLNKWTIMNLIRNYVQKQTIQKKLSRIDAEYLRKLEKKLVPKPGKNLRIQKNLNDSFAILSKFSENNRKTQKPTFLSKRIEENDLTLARPFKKKKENLLNISKNMNVNNNIILKKSILLMFLTNMNYRKIGYSFSSYSEDKDYQFFTILGLNNKTHKNKSGLPFNEKDFQTSFFSPYQENYARKMNSISAKFFQPLLSSKINSKEIKIHFQKKLPLLTPRNSENRLYLGHPLTSPHLPTSQKMGEGALPQSALAESAKGYDKVRAIVRDAKSRDFALLHIQRLNKGEKQFKDSSDNFDLYKNTYHWKPYSNFIFKWNPSFCMLKKSGIFYFTNPFSPILFLHKKSKFTPLKQFSCNQFVSKKIIKDYSNQFFFPFFDLSLKEFGIKNQKCKYITFLSICRSQRPFFFKKTQKLQVNKNTFFVTYIQKSTDDNKNLKTLFLLPNLLTPLKEKKQVILKKNDFLEKRSIPNKIISFKFYKSLNFSPEKILKSNKIIKIADKKTKDSIYNLTRNQKYILRQNPPEENIAIFKKQREAERTQKKLNIFDQKEKNRRNQIKYSYSSKKKFSVNMGEIYWIPQENYEINPNSESDFSLFKSSLKEISDKRQMLLFSRNFENLDIMSEKSKNSYQTISYPLNNIKNSVINTRNKDHKDVIPKKNSILFLTRDNYKKNTLRIILSNRQGKKKEIIPTLKGLIKIKKQKFKTRNDHLQVKSILNSSVCLSSIKFKFLKFIYKRYISTIGLTDFSQVKPIHLYSSLSLSNNKTKRKEFFTQQVKLNGQFKNQTTYFNQLNLFNKIKEKLNSNENQSLYKKESNHLNDLNSLDNNKNTFQNNNLNLRKSKYLDTYPSLHGHKGLSSVYAKDMKRSSVKQDLFNSIEKVNISLHPGWVVVLHKEKNYLKTSYHQSIHEFGNNLFEEIMFDTHRVYITNILLPLIIKGAEKSKMEINSLGLNKKQPFSFKVSKWIHSSLEDPLLRKKYNLVRKIKFLSKNNKKEMNKSFLQDKNEIHIFRSDLKVLNSDIYQVLPAPKNRIAFFIRPMNSFLLPHIHKYKKQLYKLHKKMEEPPFSLLILENYFSSLLNKQKKDFKLISHPSKILLDFSTKIKLPILNKKPHLTKSQQIVTLFDNQSFLVYQSFPIVQLKLMYNLSKNSCFKIPYLNFNSFSNLSLQGCQFYQSKKYQIYLRSLLNRKNILSDSFSPPYNKENKRWNSTVYKKEKDYIFSLYYLNFFSFSTCFDFSLNSKMSTFANQRTLNISNRTENATSDHVNSYLTSVNKNLFTNTFNRSSKIKLQKNKIKTKISNVIQQNETFGWTGFYSPFEGEILFNAFYNPNSLQFRQSFLKSPMSPSTLKEPLNLMSFAFISRFNKIKKQVTDANIKLLKNSSYLQDKDKGKDVDIKDIVAPHRRPNQKNYDFYKNDTLLLTRADIFTLNFPCKLSNKLLEVNRKTLLENNKYKNQIHLKSKIQKNPLLNTLMNRSQTFLNIETMILDELKASNEKMRSNRPTSMSSTLMGGAQLSGGPGHGHGQEHNIFTYKNEKYQIKNLRIGSLNPYPKLRLASFLLQHDPISIQSVTKKSGQIIHLSSSSLTLRNAQPIAISNRGSLYYQNGDFITKNSPIVTLPFQTLKTGDIVQGIPKVEQILEARTTRGGRLFLQSLPVLLQCLFERYSQMYPFDVAVRKSILKIQQLIVDAIQRVYRSQGVSIADKHVEIIVRQMTMKVQIIHPGYTGFFPGELIHLETIEFLNQALLTKVKYAPIVLGISKAALEVDSFLSAASFQYTTKVLTKAALFRKRDFLKGLKENLLVGNLLPAGTGYFVYLQDQKNMNS